MAFKLSRTGATYSFQPVELTLDLTPEQQQRVFNITGQCLQKIQLTAADMRYIIAKAGEPKAQ